MENPPKILENLVIKFKKGFFVQRQKNGGGGVPIVVLEVGPTPFC